MHLRYHPLHPLSAAEQNGTQSVLSSGKQEPMGSCSELTLTLNRKYVYWMDHACLLAPSPFKDLNISVDTQQVPQVFAAACNL